MKKRILLFLMIISILSTLQAAGRTEDDGAFRIVTTTGIISDVVFEIAGESVELYRLIPPAQDPHSYEPTPRDIAMVEKADLVFVNGFDLEEGLLSIVENVHKGKIVELSSKINAIKGEHAEEDQKDEAEEHHHEMDPHTWMSPMNVRLWAELVVEELSQADPAGSGEYRERGDAYIEKLDDLDRQIRAKLEILAPKDRVLVTDHDVFGYFARDYGFRIAGTLLKGYSTSSEPSPKDIAGLIELLDKEDIRAIFIGESSGAGIRKLAQTVSEETQGRIALRELLTGSLKPEGQQGDTYIGMMEYNVNAIISGLSRQ